MNSRRTFFCLLAGGLAAAAQTPAPPGPPVLQHQAAPTAQMAPMAPVAPFQVTDYALALQFDFPAHQFGATAKVTLSAQQPIAGATFHLNQNLVVTEVTDGAGQSLQPIRQGDGVVVSFGAPMAAGATQTLTFTYHGMLSDASLSPISGIRTAYVGPDGAFLLYPGAWFPLGAYGTDRFNLSVSASLPSSLQMVASGDLTKSDNGDGTTTWSYHTDHASLPGSVLVSPLKPQNFNEGGVNATFYFDPDVPAALVQQYAVTASQTYTFMDQHFGSAPVTHLTFVELPDDALPSFSSPGVIVLSKGNIGSAVNPNLMMDEVAQQWWGIETSPATLNDAWLQYGAARFCEAAFVEQTQGKAAWQDLVDQLEIGALTYTDTPLSNSATLYPFSPQFQDLNYDKGAMLFHMLRWQIGDDKLYAGMKAFLAAHAWQPVTTAEFETSLEQSGSSDLRAFFTQWYRGSQVPQFTPAWQLYRETSGGFRVQGKITQNLDLFAMPVAVRVQTEGGTEIHTVQVAGNGGEFSIEVKARPLKIEVDPDNWILKTDPAMSLKVDLARGDNLVAAGDFQNALKQYKDALDQSPISSLAHYRLAEAYFQQQNLQAATDEYRQAINGDLDPKWIEVWSHIELGKIFDLSGQRERARSEYEQAIATHDDTMGAQAAARQYLNTPYKATANGT